MNIRQFQYFISVAEHLSFTKAAKEHFIAQTAMSQQIAAIEKQLGVKLFLRSNRSVQLTAAGNIFLREAKLIVSLTDEAIRKTQHAASGIVGSLKIGFLGPNEKHFLPHLIRNFRSTYPNISLNFIQDNTETINSYIKRGLLDIAFTDSYNLDEISDFHWKLICSDPICVVLHREHPLANETKISLSALVHEAFVTIDSQEYHNAFSHMLDFITSKGGFTPQIISQHRHPETVLLMIEAGVGIALLPHYFLNAYVNPDLKFIELEGEGDFVHTIVTWQKQHTNPSIPLFLNQLATILDERKSSY